MVSFRTDGNTFHIIGDISIESGTSFQHILQDAQKKATSVIDFSLVEKWDTSSIQLLLAYTKQCTQDHSLFTAIPTNMKNDAELMGLTTLFAEEYYDENSSNS